MTSTAPPFSAPPLRREIDGGVATLTLQSPASRNALSLAMIEALIDAFAAIEADPATRVVVLAGEGTGAFRRPRPQGAAGASQRRRPRPRVL
jgi:enoyl-CoA hydratase/carnithine racemase